MERDRDAWNPSLPMSRRRRGRVEAAAAATPKSTVGPRSRTAALTFATACLMLVAIPSLARAHGPVAPIATSYLARIRSAAGRPRREGRRRRSAFVVACRTDRNGRRLGLSGCAVPAVLPRRRGRESQLADVLLQPDAGGGPTIEPRASNPSAMVRRRPERTRTAGMTAGSTHWRRSRSPRARRIWAGGRYRCESTGVRT